MGGWKDGYGLVLGTEISDTAEQFPNTIQWDFHNAKAEWLSAADFIYSNSLDHAFDPLRALTQWMRCLQPRGVLFLEHCSGHSEIGVIHDEDTRDLQSNGRYMSGSDMFGASFSEYLRLIL